MSFPNLLSAPTSTSKRGGEENAEEGPPVKKALITGCWVELGEAIKIAADKLVTIEREYLQLQREQGNGAQPFVEFFKRIAECEVPPVEYRHFYDMDILPKLVMGDSDAYAALWVNAFSSQHFDLLSKMAQRDVSSSALSSIHKELAKQECSLSEPSFRKMTVLQFAVEKEAWDLVCQLLVLQASVGERKEKTSNWLGRALGCGRTDLIGPFVRWGSQYADIMREGKPLLVWVMDTDRELAQEMVRLSPQQAATVLNECLKLRNGETMALRLLDLGVRGDFCDVQGIFPLHVAVKRPYLTTVKKILEEQGVDVNLRVERSNSSILHLVKDDSALTEYLVTRPGVAIDAIDGFGNTPLHIALQKKYCVTAQILLRAGADVKRENNARKNAWLLAAEHKPTAEVRTLLEREWENVRFNNEQGHQWFLQAIACGDLRAVKFAAERGVNVNKRCRDMQGRPLVFLALDASCEILEYLLSKQMNGLEGYVNNDGRTITSFTQALVEKKYGMAIVLLRHYKNFIFSLNEHLASHEGALKIWQDKSYIELLLYANIINFSSQNNVGDTPLHYAVNKKDAAFVRRLLQMGSPIDVVDDGKRTPFEVAVLNKTHCFDVTFALCEKRDRLLAFTTKAQEEHESARKIMYVRLENFFKSLDSVQSRNLILLEVQRPLDTPSLAMASVRSRIAELHGRGVNPYNLCKSIFSENAFVLNCLEKYESECSEVALKDWMDARLCDLLASTDDGESQSQLLQLAYIAGCECDISSFVKCEQVCTQLLAGQHLYPALHFCSQLYTHTISKEELKQKWCESIASCISPAIQADIESALERDAGVSFEQIRIRQAHSEKEREALKRAGIDVASVGYAEAIETWHEDTLEKVHLDFAKANGLPIDESDSDDEAPMLEEEDNRVEEVDEAVFAYNKQQLSIDEEDLSQQANIIRAVLQSLDGAPEKKILRSLRAVGLKNVCSPKFEVALQEAIERIYIRDFVLDGQRRVPEFARDILFAEIENKPYVRDVLEE